MTLNEYYAAGGIRLQHSIFYFGGLSCHFMAVLKFCLAAAAAVWASFCICLKECKFTVFGKVASIHLMFPARMLNEPTKFVYLSHQGRISRR